MSRKVALCCLAIVTAALLTGAPAWADEPTGQKVRPKVEVVFCLDTTGSMTGLIEAAKQKIWAISNQIASGKPTPRLKIGLVAFRDRGDEYVTKVTDLTDDLDAIYAQLMKFQANGGGDEPESVNKALLDAVTHIHWSKNQSTLKLIFLVGDAPPHMDYDEVKYPEICKMALKKGIVINTVQCGPSIATKKFWKDICEKGNGSYVQIDANGGPVAVIATPFDAALADMNVQLAKSTLVYGGTNEQREANAKVMTWTVADATGRLGVGGAGMGSMYGGMGATGMGGMGMGGMGMSGMGMGGMYGGIYGGMYGGMGMTGMGGVGGYGAMGGVASYPGVGNPGMMDGYGYAGMGGLSGGLFAGMGGLSGGLCGGMSGMMYGGMMGMSGGMMGMSGGMMGMSGIMYGGMMGMSGNNIHKLRMFMPLQTSVQPLNSGMPGLSSAGMGMSGMGMIGNGEMGMGGMGGMGMGMIGNGVMGGSMMGMGGMGMGGGDSGTGFQPYSGNGVQAQIAKNIGAYYAAKATIGSMNSTGSARPTDSSSGGHIPLAPVYLSPAIAADRASFCATTGCVASYDLLDSIKAGKVKLEDLKKEELPKELQGLGLSQQREYLEELSKTRAEMMKKVVEVSKKRNEFIVKKQAEDVTNGGRDSFDNQVLRILQRQAERNGIDYSDASEKKK